MPKETVLFSSKARQSRQGGEISALIGDKLLFRPNWLAGMPEKSEQEKMPIKAGKCLYFV